MTIISARTLQKMNVVDRTEYLERVFRYRIRINAGDNNCRLDQISQWLDQTHGEWRACSVYDHTLDMNIYINDVGQARMFELFWSHIIVAVEDLTRV